ncbi:protein SDA1 homolog [Haliotis rufescens]|uniref:protein SDA1 homolog n=1 Tax=Haliotis rufescens TaxID=6454 RepID=UPI00201F4A5F|nr:protein SDA1 homolog [Haliotis rufescens]
MTDRNRNKLPTNLPQLQNLIKRDSESYKDEFLQQYRHYQSNLQLFQLKPSAFSKTLEELLIFLAQVSHCYPGDLSEFPQQLRDLLHRHATALDPTMRLSMVKSLILLRNKGLIPATSILELFFELFRCQDKLLRKTLYKYIVTDIKNVNSKRKNMQLNSTLQSFMYTMLTDKSPVAAKMSLDVMIELYKKNVWNDAKTVNVITTACFSKYAKILVAAVKFFLGRDELDQKAESDSDDDDDDKTSKKTARELSLAYRVGKKTKNRERKLKRALAVLKKQGGKKKKAEVFNFSAMHLIHDPQEFSERLFKKLESSNERFEVKLLMMDLISRLIGIHQLFLFNFYPFLKRFLQPHQREVTKLLLFVAQASHELVPPDVIEEVLLTISNNFITERNSREVMAVGLNSVREVCARCPLAIGEDLLGDLVQYKSHRDKTVMMAARALIQVYRQHNPALLHKKDRGRPTDAKNEHTALKYGERNTKDYIPGAEALEEMEDDAADKPQDGDDWQSCSEGEEDGDSDGEWVTVQHSSDEEQQEELTKLVPADPAERKRKAQDISANRILSQEDFAKINQLQASKQVQHTSTKGKKRKSLEVETERRGELPNLADIENVHKRRAHDKESRLATVLAGREDRGKYAHGREKMNPDASTTNKQKKKSKPFMMVKHKMQRKVKRSFKDKQIALRNSLLKRQRMSKKF